MRVLVWDLQPLWVSDVQRALEFPLAKAAMTQGVHSMLGVPICHGGNTLAVMEFFERQPCQVDGELMR